MKAKAPFGRFAPLTYTDPVTLRKIDVRYVKWLGEMRPYYIVVERLSDKVRMTVDLRFCARRAV